MTNKGLSQLYYLKKEVANQEERLKELQALSTKVNTNITGLPKSKNFSSNVEKYAVEITELKISIENNIKRCFDEMKTLNNFINTINDSQMRIILTLRYIDCLSWKQIAFKVGALDESVPRRKHNKFLRNFELAEKAE